MKNEILEEDALETGVNWSFREIPFSRQRRDSEKSSHCIVFCKKLSSNVFEIKKGIAVLTENNTALFDGNCLIVHPMKNVFVFE